MASNSRARGKKPTKRRGPGGRSGHHPRTTDPAAVPRPPSARKVFPIRPTWHKVAGGGALVLGIGIIVVNYWEEFGAQVLPGGHSIAYFMLGLLVMASSAWWFGVFDKPL